MTTPAGWYDDGSGRQRWWDGTQWTEHFAPVADVAAATDAGTGAAEAPADTTTPADAVQADPVQADPVQADPVQADAAQADAVQADPVQADAAQADALQADPVQAEADPSTGAPVDDVEAPASPADAAPTEVMQDAVIAPGEANTPDLVVDPDPVVAPADPAAWASPAAADAQPTVPFVAPGATAPTAPIDGPVPPYAGGAQDYAAPAYAAPAYAAPAYAQAAPAYPAAGGYPPAGGYPVGGYPAAPAAPASISVLGLIGLGLAAFGTILSCIPFTFVFGWVLLFAGFVVSIISLFLKGKKWPGITGLALSVVGTAIAVIMAIIFAVTAVNQAIDSLPSSPPSSDTGTTDGGEDSDGGGDGFTSAETVEGVAGEPVTVTQLDGTSELTVTSATWAASNGSGFDPANGGYLTVEFTWANLDGTTHVNPFYLSVETAEGAEGSYDFFSDNQLPTDDLTGGASVDARIAFDVAQSSSYTVIVLDELLQEVARITVQPSA